MRKFLLIALAGLSMAVATGCEEEGPMEEFGESMDNAVEDVRDSGSEMGREMEHAVDEMSEGVEDACEEIKDGMDADNPNC